MTTSMSTCRSLNCCSAGPPGRNMPTILTVSYTHLAQCGEFLKRLEKGIYTMAGDGGKGLSGGERQRIALARAILKDAPIVVLDLSLIHI